MSTDFIPIKQKDDLQIGDSCKVKGTDVDYCGYPLKRSAKNGRWKIVGIEGDCICLGNSRTGKVYHRVHRDYIQLWRKGGQ